MTLFLRYATCILILLPALAKTQGPVWSWAKSAGSTSSGDFANAITADANGNAYMVGGYSGDITFGATTLTLSMSGIMNACLVKYDAAGNVLWAKNSVGHHDGEQGMAVVTDAGGNIYVAGQYRGSNIKFDAITLTNPGTGYGNMFLVKYDASGTVLWAKSMGGTMEETPSSLSIDASGNLYVTGSFSSPSLTVAATTLTNAGGNDVFIIKYDASGNALWATSAGGAGDDMSNAIETDASGNVHITGTFRGATIVFGTSSLTNSGSSSQDIFVAKYNSTGTVAWAASGAGSSNSDYATALTVDASGNVYASGFFFSTTLQFGATSLTKKGASDIFITKYDTGGNLVWARNEGVPTQDTRTKTLAHDAAGDIYIAGTFNGFGTLLDTIHLASASTFMANDDDVFVTKYNSSGHALWARSAGGLNTEILGSIFVAGADDVYITGDLFASATFGPFVLNTVNQSFDMFAARLSAPPVVTGLKTTDHTASIRIYPNPASSELFISSTEKIKHISCLNYAGQAVEIKPSPAGVNVAPLAAGIYFLTIITETGQQTVQKFVRE